MTTTKKQHFVALFFLSLVSSLSSSAGLVGPEKPKAAEWHAHRGVAGAARGWPAAVGRHAPRAISEIATREPKEKREKRVV